MSQARFARIANKPAKLLFEFGVLFEKLFNLLRHRILQFQTLGSACACAGCVSPYVPNLGECSRNRFLDAVGDPGEKLTAKS